MKWEQFLDRFGDLPLIEPAVVYAGQTNTTSLQAQLSRWVGTGRLIKLARGKYILANPYRRIDPPVEYLANKLVYPSYVSLERLLSWHGLIPEAVPVVTSVTTGRPSTYDTALGTFTYRHIARRLFWGYESVTMHSTECAMALPEKALLDLFHFWRGAVTRARIEEMRFQNTDQLDAERLRAFAKRAGGRKLTRSIEQFLVYCAKGLERSDLT